MSNQIRNTDEIRIDATKYGADSATLPENTEALETDESREAYDLLPDLTKEEWRRVHLVPRHGNLIQGAPYFDLRHPARGGFVVHGPMEVRPNDMYVAKHEVDSEIWDKLVGKG